MARPGALTVAYVEGVRKPYLGPFQLFLLANVLFFATQSRTDNNIVGTTLESHLYIQDWSALAQSLVARRLATLHTTLDLYTPIFNHAVQLHAKSLIIVMTLPFALLLPIVFLGNRQPFVAHAVFSLHFYAFLLLLYCASLVVTAIDVGLGGAGMNSARLDTILSIIILAVCFGYLYLATAPVYGARGVMRVVKALVLAVAVTGILLGYRFALFLLTLYTT